MPRGPRRPCTYPGCTALVGSGRCDQHPYPRLPDTRASSSERGYDAAWRKTRDRYLRSHRTCEIMRKCSGAPAREVDHVTPRAEGGTDHDGNLQAACKPCHSWKTATLDTARGPGGRFKGRPTGERHERRSQDRRGRRPS